MISSVTKDKAHAALTDLAVLAKKHPDATAADYVNHEMVVAYIEQLESNQRQPASSVAEGKSAKEVYDEYCEKVFNSPAPLMLHTRIVEPEEYLAKPAAPVSDDAAEAMQTALATSEHVDDFDMGAASDVIRLLADQGFTITRAVPMTEAELFDAFAALLPQIISQMAGVGRMCDIAKKFAGRV